VPRVDVDQIELQRLLYRQGQTLLSQDFRDEVKFDAQRRWWHNRAVHSAFGIVEGFQATQSGGNVLVSPGLAYDCFGRELIGKRLQTITIPDGPDTMTLLVQHKDVGTYELTADMIEACLPDTGALVEVRPNFVWKKADQVQPQDGVPIAQFIYSNEQPQPDPEFHPPSVRPLARPVIANGATIPGGTPWTLWLVQFGPLFFPVGLQVTIDTSSAGFTEAPCYFAWLKSTVPSLVEQNPLEALLVGWHVEYIMDISDTSFTFRILLPMLVILVQDVTNILVLIQLWMAIVTALLGFAQQQQLSVCWMGLQSQPGAAQNSNGGE
jgi:hypothetical protein